MGSFSKRLKRSQKSESESESEMGSEEENGFMNEVTSEEDADGSNDSDDEESGGHDAKSSGEDGEEEDDDGDEEDGNELDDDEDEDEDEDEEDEDDAKQKDNRKDDEIEELEKEYRDLQKMEENLIQNLKRHKDEDLLKGQAIKSQKTRTKLFVAEGNLVKCSYVILNNVDVSMALCDKALEIRFLLQKAFSKSNKLPQEPVRSFFCEADDGVSAAYSDLVTSSKKTICSLLQLQEALVENNPSIADVAEEGESQSSLKSTGESNKMDVEKEKEWLQISQMQSRVAAFRNQAVDKWQRKADVHSGAVAKKAKLLAFNQNISNQVATYMRDPSKMIKSMQMRRGTVGVFGSVAPHAGKTNEERNAEGDPELLDDSDFYQQLLKEFFETVDPKSSEPAFYALKRLQIKKRKVVDRRASKSRKIRYHVHEKIVNFMAPQPMNLPPMAPKLFENLFGLKTQKPSSAV
ncbi:hypothetical protein Cgig2_013062 [Carnegiea gigantea]|uniref:Protein AATF n=1 Tax=Carnegiea gigantea TaxID=171969 RepID=A0A9Q1QP68_9CARY|nr:hypothetical protein Cgig2_013062 [Carnegiea gigantea]